MLVNIAWPRGAPSLTNPTPNQDRDANGHLLLNFGWHWLNDQPVLWTVVVVVTLVGAIYFAIFQRRKPAYLQAPEGEVFATGETPTPARAT